MGKKSIITPIPTDLEIQPAPDTSISSETFRNGMMDESNRE
jgi:hypothetical protein